MREKIELCTVGMVEQAEELLEKLEARELSDDYDPGILRYNQTLTNIPHQYTNYGRNLLNCQTATCFVKKSGDIDLKMMGQYNEQA